MDRPAWQGWRTAAVVVGVLLVTLSIGLVVTSQMVRPDQADGDAPADEPRGVAGTFGSTVAASGSPTPPPPPSATATAVPSPPPVSYPASADEYATALLNAWLAGDTGRVGELATPATITLMGQAPGSLPGGWEFFDCWYEPFNPCRQLRDDRGDTFGVQVDPALLGQPRAVTRVYVDLIRYETAVLPYVQYVLDAWSGANDERVAQLMGSWWHRSAVTRFRPASSRPTCARWLSSFNEVGPGSSSLPRSRSIARFKRLAGTLPSCGPSWSASFWHARSPPPSPFAMPVPPTGFWPTCRRGDRARGAGGGHGGGGDGASGAACGWAGSRFALAVVGKNVS